MEKSNLLEKHRSGFMSTPDAAHRAASLPMLSFLVCALAMLFCSCSTSRNIYYKPFFKKEYFSSVDMKVTRLSDLSLIQLGYRPIGIVFVTLEQYRCARNKCETFKHDKSSIELLYSEAKKHGAHLLKVMDANKKHMERYNAAGKCKRYKRKQGMVMKYMNGQVKQVPGWEDVCVEWEGVPTSVLSYESSGVLWRKKSDL